VSITKEELTMHHIIATLPEEEQETVKTLESIFSYLIEAEGYLGLMAASLAVINSAKKYS
jgi:hypothetical protein